MATVKVGMADLNICRAPDMITTLGLGVLHWNRSI